MWGGGEEDKTKQRKGDKQKPSIESEMGPEDSRTGSQQFGVSRFLAASLPESLLHLWSLQESPASSTQSSVTCDQEPLSSKIKIILVLYTQSPVLCRSTDAPLSLKPNL